MMSTDYRGALRTMFATANPDWDDAERRDRVAADRRGAAAGGRASARMKNWIDDEVTEEARAVGDRLWMLEDGTNPGSRSRSRGRRTRSCRRRTCSRSKTGAVSRPDITAGVIRSLTSGAAASAHRAASRRSRSSSEFQAPTDARSHGRPGIARTITPSRGEAVDLLRRRLEPVRQVTSGVGPRRATRAARRARGADAAAPPPARSKTASQPPPRARPAQPGRRPGRAEGEPVSKQRAPARGSSASGSLASRTVP